MHHSRMILWCKLVLIYQGLVEEEHLLKFFFFYINYISFSISSEGDGVVVPEENAGYNDTKLISMPRTQAWTWHLKTAHASVGECRCWHDPQSPSWHNYLMERDLTNRYPDVYLVPASALPSINPSINWIRKRVDLAGELGYKLTVGRNSGKVHRISRWSDHLEL